MKYASNNIRNILIAGHAGSGKTTLTEALVYFSGAAERMGRVEDGTTISDFDPEEAKRKASLSASVVPVEYEGIKYNLIDAPGLFDFEAGEYEGIRAAESVLVCVSSRSGVTVGAEKAFQLARKNGKATMVFVSKCDLENANYFKILEDMKIRFGSTICPCVVPAKLDDGTPVYINLFSQKAFKYEGGKQIQVDLPDIGHRFQGLIEAMSEAIAETDDELMEKFFGGEPFTTEEIVEGMRKGVKDGLITPVFCGSAVNMQALDMLLFNMHKLLPSPQHDAAILAENASGEPVELHCDETEPTAAYVFKTVADPFVGKLTFFRVYSGTLQSNSYVYNASKGKRERVGKITLIHASSRTEIPEAHAGDIAALGGLKETGTGDTLCDEKHPLLLETIEIPDPVIQVAIEPKTKAGQEKMGLALAKLADEDPTFRTFTDKETGQTIISGMGELHLEIIVDRLIREFHVECKVGRPQVAYRETISRTVKSEGRYVRQTGGHGQYGHCVVEFSPLEPGAGFEFEDKTVGGVIPKEYIPAIKAGIEEASKTGSLGGFEVVDFKATLLDGSYHDVDSSEMAYKIAASMALKDALEKAGCVLLEPVMKVEVVMPDEYMGDVIGNLTSRRCRIEGTDSRGNAQVVDAICPLSEMFGYATDLRSRTQGRGTFTMQFDHYEQVSEAVAKKILGK